MRSLLSGLTVLFLTSPHYAQETRFELGQRLRAFEAEWDRVTDSEARKRAVPFLKQATTSFFTFSQGEAARGLDLARLALTTKTPSPDVLWAASCVMKPSSRFIEPGEVAVSLDRLYRPRDKQPEGIRFRVQLLRRGKSALSAVLEDIKELPCTVKLNLKDFEDGDYLLIGEVMVKSQSLARSEQTLSVANKRTIRLERVEKLIVSFAEKKTTEAKTAASLLDTLKRLAGSETLETNYPAADLLAEVELLVKVLVDDTPFYKRERAGQHWLSLPGKGSGISVRVQVPDAAKKGKPLPLVIAMHGAGGSENMFFDGYGNGAVAKLCAERGWLLVTTRNGLSEGTIDELAKLYPVDRKKVFLVGHSMGAAQATAAASREPEKFAAVAALGGGGSVRASDALANVAFFVGVGKEDFALRGSRALKTSLERAKVAKVVYKEYDDIEHLVIVQLCLPEVFTFFDEIAKRPTTDKGSP